AGDTRAWECDRYHQARADRRRAAWIGWLGRTVGDRKASRHEWSSCAAVLDTSPGSRSPPRASNVIRTGTGVPLLPGAATRAPPSRPRGTVTAGHRIRADF